MTNEEYVKEVYPDAWAQAAEKCVQIARRPA